MEESVECACGCGQHIVPKRSHRWYTPRFIVGHRARLGGMPRRRIPTGEELPSGICGCGCGQSTPLAKRTVSARRHFKGLPIPFLQNHHPPKLKGSASYKWKGGRRMHKGYVLVYAGHDHHLADKDGYVAEHRLVMERTLGRPLLPGEVVHHLNHIKHDNRPDNLVVMSHGEHSTLHAPDRDYTSPETRRRMRENAIKGAEARWTRDRITGQLLNPVLL